MAHYVGVFMVVAALGFPTAKASAVSPFFDSGFECLNSTTAMSCTSDPNLAFIWNTGDYFGESFTGTGLSSIVELSLDTLLGNALAVGQTETFDVSVNGVVVGSVSVPGSGVTSPGTPQTLTQMFNFSPISGPNYDVRFTVTSPTIGVLLGSIGFNHDGLDSSVTLASVPEPGTMLLLGAGLLGLVVRRARKA
jgi:hypothetical protein